jgi:glycosyltransferase involved in cell wall biosynthesis
LVSVVIPALNEQENIRTSVLTVINAAKAAGDVPLEIILVNDGSTDRTREICDDLAREYPFIRPIHHPTNMGQGASILDGIRVASHDLVTMVPADNALPTYTIRNLLANSGKADYVIAMIMNTEYRSPRRIVLSKIYSNIYTLTFGLPIKYINAPALWPVERVRKMNLRAQRYSLHGEINVKLLRQPITFVEVDGYMNPTMIKSSAVRLKNVMEVAFCYLRLLVEVFVTQRKEYAHRAQRVLPPGVVDR